MGLGRSCLRIEDEVLSHDLRTTRSVHCSSGLECDERSETYSKANEAEVSNSFGHDVGGFGGMGEGLQSVGKCGAVWELLLRVRRKQLIEAGEVEGAEVSGGSGRRLQISSFLALEPGGIEVWAVQLGSVGRGRVGQCVRQAYRALSGWRGSGAAGREAEQVARPLRNPVAANEEGQQSQYSNNPIIHHCPNQTNAEFLSAASPDRRWMREMEHFLFLLLQKEDETAPRVFRGDWLLLLSPSNYYSGEGRTPTSERQLPLHPETGGMRRSCG